MPLKLELGFTSEKQLFELHAQINQIKGLTIGALAKGNQSYDYKFLFGEFERVVENVNSMMQQYSIEKKY